MSGAWGSSPYGIEAYGSAFDPFGVANAIALSPNIVQLTFTDPIDPSYTPFFDPANYVLVPGLTVTSIAVGSSMTLLLTTTDQSYVVYEITVQNAKSLDNKDLSLALRSATFTGFSTDPNYLACGTREKRVRLLFSAPMLLDSALSDPSSYTMTDMDGNGFTINEVIVEQSVLPRSLILILNADMETSKWYQVTTSGLTTDTGLHPSGTKVFQWVKPKNSFQIDVSSFSGEVFGGLFGTPAGQVFFSPALQASTANSTIQVDTVHACTTAYDTWTWPEVLNSVDFFYTWSASGPQTTLGEDGITLWTPSKVVATLNDSGVITVINLA